MSFASSKEILDGGAFVFFRKLDFRGSLCGWGDRHILTELLCNIRSVKSDAKQWSEGCLLVNTSSLKKLALFVQEPSRQQHEGLANSLKFSSLCINGCVVARAL